MSKNILVTKASLIENKKIYFVQTKINDNHFYSDCLYGGEEGIKSILSREHIDHILILSTSDNDNDGIIRHTSNYLHNNHDDRFLNKFKELIGNNNAQAVNSFIDSYISKCENEDCTEKEYIKNLLEYNNTQILLNKMYDTCSDLTKSDYIDNYAKLYLFKRLPSVCKMFCREDNENADISIMDVGPSSNIYNPDILVHFKKCLITLIEDGDEDVNLIFYDYATKASNNYALKSILKMISDQNRGVNLIKHYGVIYLDGNAYVEDETEKYLIGSLADGMSAFTEYGKVDKIVKLIQYGNIKNEAVISLVYAMNTIDSGISLCDIDSIVYGINDIKEIINQEHSFDNSLAQLFYEFMEASIKESYASLLEGEQIDYFELVKWACNKKFYQQALTIVEAKMPEIFVNKGIYYFYDESSDEEELIEKFATEYSYLKPYETYKMEYLDHYFIKSYLRSNNKKQKTEIETQKGFAKLKISQIGTSDDSMIKAYTKCTDYAALEDTLFAYYNIGSVRNKTNHAEAKKKSEIELIRDKSKETEKMKLVQDSIKFFINSYELALSKLDNSDYIRRDINYGKMKTRAGEIRNERYNKK